MRFFVGLRGRLMLALLAVTVAALAGAAIALFTPLDKRLRDDALTNVTSDAITSRQALTHLDHDQIYPRSRALIHISHSLRRVGADLAIYDPRGMPLLGADPDLRIPPGSSPRPIGRVQRRIVGHGDDAAARVVVATRTRAGVLTIAVSRSLKEVQSARNEFVKSFVRASAVTLLVALVLGFILSTRLSRRTRALRDAALAVAASGPGVDPPHDTGHDEIGDLAGAFRTMQERLRSQEEARKTFVSTASHELRTPIAALQLRLGLLQEDLASDGTDLADAREQVAHSAAQAGRLAKLAGDLLDLSRLDADVPLRREPVELGALSRVTVAEFDAVPGVTVTVDDARAGIALGDPGKLAQIIRILIDNASRHAPDGYPIRVVVDGTTIAVEDDGEGVAPDEQELIFDRFRRGEGHEGHPGFGLGLAIGRELARRMGGELVLRRRAHPTRFELVLEAVVQPER